ncbi:MAG: helix-hairpin-helix domain-containing protein [Acidimicrobiia bacterium]
MKRLAKVIGFIGGIVALAWAMRDRFISVAVSREPQPPAFRSPAATEQTIPLDAVEGIGPVFAGRLRAAGISDAGRLAQASPDSVAESASVSAARARTWIERARSLG